MGMVKCPFHNDKTPSMSVNIEKNMFYCFGCGAGGDPITFVQKIDNLSFIDACKKMAEWYGITACSKSPDNNAAYERIVTWAEKNLQKEDSAIKYLNRRGLNEESIKAFRIGWIGDEFPLAQHNLSQALLEKMGLAKNITQFFKRRIIFPITMHNKHIGIGGRGFFGAKNLPKYLNTSFQKNEYLFGFDQAKAKLRNKDLTLVLVEGYLDAILCYQYGIPAVASLGTNVSEQQLSLCFELAKSVAICMDGDSAGRLASEKIAYKLLNLIKPGYSAHFINLPNEEDPASYLAYNKFLPKKHINLLEKLWDVKNIEQYSSNEMKVEAYESLLSLLKTIQNSTLRHLYLTSAKKMWFNRPAIIKSIAHPQRMRELLLLSIFVHFPALFNDLSDYVIAMELEGVLYDFREYMLESYSSQGFASDEKLVESFSLYTLEEIYNIAPFLLSPEKQKDAWLELFNLYWEAKT